ncbi:MAG: hypothetical protein CFE44_10990 [Burkholderiales bacterium PBB4]|nr:MAG: hypothetical protein CFE44_10990 [Burkholderiales bacterium PBB4]
MTPSLVVLLAFASWTLLLVTGIATLRVVLSLTGQRRPNQFLPAGDDVSPFSGRLCRAHANCVENLPTYAALVLVAHLSGHGAVLEGLAWLFLGARIAQSCIHLTSGRSKAVMLRFSCMAVQIAIQAIWVVRLGLAWMS